MKEIHLKTALGESRIYCGSGALQSYFKTFQKSDGGIFVITDSTVAKLYKNIISEIFGSDAFIYVFPAGERSKNMNRLQDILRSMLAYGLKRSGFVAAFGGGVTGDIAGFAASIYMRGARLIQIPTTLLSQVDSSVGGKTAVNFGGTKNVIGTFYQPETVIADQIFLNTLPAREVRCGLGEIIKYGALNKDIFEKLIRNRGNLKEIAISEEIIYDCVLHKANVVEKDEFDLSGERKSLNLGHTTAHALELGYGKKSHGEYVLIGLYYEAYIAEQLKICNESFADELEKLINSVIKIPSYDNFESAVKLASRDKKNVDSNISLIVPVNAGEWKEVKLSKERYLSYLTECSRKLKEDS